VCYDFRADLPMKRLAAIIVFAGAVLLSTHILAPAAPPKSLPAINAAELAAIDQTQSTVDEVNAQVDRLRERLSAPPNYPAPTRDPFRFGKTADPAPPKPAPAPSVAPAAPVVAAPALPRLVAIVSDTTDAGSIRSAVLSVGEDVQIVKMGDSVSKLVVQNIGVDVIELADPVSGAIFRILLH
jgi:outer membrane murein-binding lipoprotein Lpp